ncbi:hypothetical protein [Candidatus Hodgkinia cicadicola]|uniref:hypothetical protein n=1 Tax=Candidatus Hodgkinia cicadicola TaxID=573658 RepID=UPI001788AC0F
MTGRLFSTKERLKVIKTNIERILNRVKTIKIDKLLKELSRLLGSKLKCGQRFVMLIGYLASKTKIHHWWIH